MDVYTALSLAHLPKSGSCALIVVYYIIMYSMLLLSILTVI